MKVCSYRFKQLISNGIVIEVIELPLRALYEFRKVYWQKHYTVIHFFYLKSVAVQLEDGEICTQQYEIKLK